MSVKVGAPVPSFATSCQRMWVPRWKPMPMQLTTVARVSVVASAAVDPSRPKKPMPVGCRVVSEIRVTKVQPPSPAALRRQQAEASPHGARRDGRGAEEETRARSDLGEGRGARARLQTSGCLTQQVASSKILIAVPSGAAVSHCIESRSRAVLREL